MRNENNFEFLIGYCIHEGHAKNDPIWKKQLRVDLTILCPGIVHLQMKSPD